jgi:hypothetical protein
VIYDKDLNRNFIVTIYSSHLSLKRPAIGRPDG